MNKITHFFSDFLEPCGIESLTKSRMSFVMSLSEAISALIGQLMAVNFIYDFSKFMLLTLSFVMAVEIIYNFPKLF